MSQTKTIKLALGAALLAAPLNSAQFVEVRNHLLAPAITEYQAALVPDPDNPVTKSNLAAAYAQTGQPAKAIALYEQVKSYPPIEETADIIEETADIAIHRLQTQPDQTKALQ